jgi:hypothetical protein
MPLWGFLCWLVVAEDDNSGCFVALGQGLIFKLEEEGNLALLIHLLKVFAETAVLLAAVVLGCWLVEVTPQVPARNQYTEGKSNHELVNGRLILRALS